VADDGVVRIAAEVEDAHFRTEPGQALRQLAAAQQLQAVLSGSVALAQGPTPPGVDLVLDVGTAVSVIPKQQPAGAAVPNPAGQPTPPQQPLPPYDPTACPASGAPPATQGSLGAKH